MSKKYEDDLLETILKQAEEIKLDDEFSSLVPSDQEESKDIIEVSEKELVIPPKTTDTSLDDDLDYARQKIKDSIDKAQDSIDELFFIAKETSHPRVFEVLAQLLEIVGKRSRDLALLHKDVAQTKQIKEPNRRSVGVNVDKAVIFNGTTNDLLDSIESKKKKEKNK